MEEYSTIYFSGTGNTKYIAKRISNRLGCSFYSVEERVDFKEIIENSRRIILCFPIYYSVAPLIVKGFIKEYTASLTGKDFIILATQYMFSGNGAMSIAKTLPSETRIIYAEHFNMPNNFVNFPGGNIFGKTDFDKACRKADKKIELIIKNLLDGVIKLRGSSGFSALLGKTQNFAEERLYETKRDSVKVADNCVLCGKCIKQCPSENLFIDSDSVKSSNNCFFCYRCVNICPKQAITVLVHSKIKYQYYVADRI